MNNLVIVDNATGELTVSSLVVAEEFGREHKNVLAAIRKLVGNHTLNQLDFKPITFLDKRGRQQPAFELTERGFLIAMPFIGGSKAEQGQVRLVDAFLTMRQSLLTNKPTQQKAPVETAIAIAESAARMLNMCDSSKLKMLQDLSKEYDSPLGFLPVYTTDTKGGNNSAQPTKSLTSILKSANIGVAAKTAYLALQAVGIVERKSRPSTKSKNGQKEFWCLTEKGLQYGKNVISPHNPLETQPHFFECMVDEIVKIIKGEEE